MKNYFFLNILLCVSCTKPEKVCFDYSHSTPNTAKVVTFNSSCSEHTYSYRWIFGDGTPEVTTTSSTITHTYNNTGTYNVTLNTERKDGMTLKKGKTTVTKTVVVQ